MLELLLSYLALGAVAGVLAGLLGIGGGLVLVPVLVALLPQQGVGTAVLMQTAVATSLACIGMTGISSALAHWRQGGVVLPALLRLIPGLCAGALFGAWVAHVLPSAFLQRFFGVAAMLLALRMFATAKAAARGQMPPAWLTAVASTAIGVLSALVGIGGGVMVVPFLSRSGVEIRQAVGTAAAATAPIAWAGVVGFVLAGWSLPDLPRWSLGYVFLPAAAMIAAASVLTAPYGARLAHRLPTATLKRVFALVLMLVGGTMLLGGR